jgi:hypothetical protein
MGRARRAPAADTQSEPQAPPETSTDAGGESTCPECGRTFARAAALGAHRRRAHGVAGTSANAKRATTRSRRGASSGRRAATRRRATAASRDGTQNNAADRDTLLAALFPDGVPPREDVIRAVGQWLDEADRLAATR